mmetsp:Transcript_25242/g.63505  ORF Transcript_25242/g.63505 Transcript_25242/m.63505 type:complete len:206 (-) Transcript_25242:262-879(-)
MPRTTHLLSVGTREGFFTANWMAITPSGIGAFGCSSMMSWFPAIRNGFVAISGSPTTCTPFGSLNITPSGDSIENHSISPSGSGLLATSSIRRTDISWGATLFHANSSKARSMDKSSTPSMRMFASTVRPSRVTRRRPHLFWYPGSVFTVEGFTTPMPNTYSTFACRVLSFSSSSSGWSTPAAIARGTSGSEPLCTPFVRRSYPP